MTESLLAVLAELGGSASVREIEDAVAKNLNLSEVQLSLPHDKSRTEFQYRLAWTRSYAKKAGLLISPRRNFWSLPIG
jgi:restriction system protein